MNVQELLQTLDLLSTKIDGGIHEHSSRAGQDITNSASVKAVDDVQMTQPPMGQCDSSQHLHAATPQIPLSEEQVGSASAPADARASVDILRARRSSNHAAATGTSDAATRQTIAFDPQSDPLANSGAGRNLAASASLPSGIFRQTLRAPDLEQPRTPVDNLEGVRYLGDVNGTAGAKKLKVTSVFDAAAFFFPDDSEPDDALPTHERSVFVSSTIVQRVIKKLGVLPIRTLHKNRAVTRGSIELQAAAFAISQDGQELLWVRDGGHWCNFFIREVKNLMPGPIEPRADGGRATYGLMPGPIEPRADGGRATYGDSCVFSVHLPDRIAEFEAATPQSMHLWLVGLLVLLESATSVVTSLRIWRSLAPWLTQASSSVGTPFQIFDAPDFPPCIENFMRECLQERTKTSIPAPLFNQEPLISGTFLRRVSCAHLVVYMKTLVRLGEYGLVLVDPNFGTEFARCDFRNETGITMNSVEFILKHDIEPPRKSGHRETMTFCMDMKDSFGACHTILLPNHDVSCNWEAAVQNVKALPHNALADRLNQSVAFGGIKALLKNLDQCRAKIPCFDHGSDSNAIDEANPVVKTDRKIDSVRESTIAPASSSDTIYPEHLLRARTFSSVRTPATPHVTFSPAHTPILLSSPVNIQSPLPQHSGQSKVVHSPFASSPSRRTGDFRPDAVIRHTADHFISHQQLRASHSPEFFPSVSSQSQRTEHVAQHLQSLADDVTYFGANFMDSQRHTYNSAPHKPAASIPGSPLATTPNAVLQYGRNDRVVDYDVRGRVSAPVASNTSPALDRARFSSQIRQSAVDGDERSGGATRRHSATAEVAARINGALADFANFQR